MGIHLIVPQEKTLEDCRFTFFASKGVELNPDQLPYHAEVLAFLHEERKRGREIVLATASDKEAVRTIARYLNIFSMVIASDGTQNLRGREKCKVLQEHLGLFFEKIT